MRRAVTLPLCLLWLAQIRLEVWATSSRTCHDFIVGQILNPRALISTTGQHQMSWPCLPEPLKNESEIIFSQTFIFRPLWTNKKVVQSIFSLKKILRKSSLPLFNELYLFQMIPNQVWEVGFLTSAECKPDCNLFQTVDSIYSPPPFQGS